MWSVLGERVDPARWRPVLAGDIETATFPVAGGGAYVMIANPRDQVHYRFTPAEAELLPLSSRTHCTAAPATHDPTQCLYRSWTEPARHLALLTLILVRCTDVGPGSCSGQRAFEGQTSGSSMRCG